MGQLVIVNISGFANDNPYDIELPSNLLPLYTCRAVATKSDGTQSARLVADSGLGLLRIFNSITGSGNAIYGQIVYMRSI